MPVELRVVRNGDGPIGAKKRIVFDDDQRGRQAESALPHPVVDAVDVDAEQIDVAGKPAGRHQLVDVLACHLRLDDVTAGANRRRRRRRAARDRSRASVRSTRTPSPESRSCRRSRRRRSPRTGGRVAPIRSKSATVMPSSSCCDSPRNRRASEACGSGRSPLRNAWRTSASTLSSILRRRPVRAIVWRNAVCSVSAAMRCSSRSRRLARRLALCRQLLDHALFVVPAAFLSGDDVLPERATTSSRERARRVDAAMNRRRPFSDPLGTYRLLHADDICSVRRSMRTTLPSTVRSMSAARVSMPTPARPSGG